MSRHARHADGNQPEVVEAIRKHGGHVIHLHMVGHGVPDLLVGWRGCWVLLEVKDGRLSPSRRALNALEAAWHAQAIAHGLPVYVVTSPAHAVEVLTKHQGAR